jgi:3-oxoacyl-[acyl-carrier protein] reductase
MSSLSGKVAIVTGASKGIGAAIAEKLAESGAKVVVNYSCSAGEAERVVYRITERGGTATAIQADLSKPSEARKLFQDTISKYGRVDVLVNNAGVYEFLPIENITEEHYERQFGLNVRGLLFASQEAVRAFNGNGGRIINISSVVSTAPAPGGSVYSATKAAVDAITKSLAVELGPKGILVNSVLPGPVETEGFNAMPQRDYVISALVPRTPLGRVAQPQDITGVVDFLASDDSSWITGQLIEASGGLRA